jgi:hypothetical protein
MAYTIASEPGALGQDRLDRDRQSGRWRTTVLRMGWR